MEGEAETGIGAGRTNMMQTNGVEFSPILQSTGISYTCLASHRFA